ncbi:hypothetical protein [Apilactobacillus quenuiae]|uniref:hypothetical protein n=1 Tax=Apilactobacillus quenuiae TaxID=2008377 RepID=UPI000D013DE3|nr:hypothetical protein [Apilactobacillus quenuiae]
MKFRNLLSLSAVTLMSLGLTMGATGLSANAAPTGNPTAPTDTSNGTKLGSTVNNSITTHPMSFENVPSLPNNSSIDLSKGRGANLSDMTIALNNPTGRNQIGYKISVLGSKLKMSSGSNDSKDDSTVDNVAMNLNGSSLTLGSGTNVTVIDNGLTKEQGMNNRANDVSLTNNSISIPNNSNLPQSIGSTANYNTTLTWTLSGDGVQNSGK